MDQNGGPGGLQRRAAGACVMRRANGLARPRPAQTPANPQALVDGDLAQLNDRLTRPAAGTHDEAALQQSREDAARRLLSRQSPRANRYVLDALAGATISHDVKLAAARAIADDPQPDPIFVGALMPLLDTERALSDASARALARYGALPAARDRLVAFAQNIAQPIAQRVSAIRALGGIVNREVADALLGWVVNPNQPAAIANAAADALADLTGQTANGHDPARWKQWQAANANKPDVVWRADIIAGRERRSFHRCPFTNRLRRRASADSQ